MWLRQVHSRRHIAWGMLWLIVAQLFVISCFFASATELDFTDKDHNHHRILQVSPDGDTSWDAAEPNAAAYQAEFDGIDRSIIGRQDHGPASLQNNVPVSMTIASGTTANFVFAISNSGGDADLNLPSAPPGSGLLKRGVEIVDISNEDGEILHSSLKKRQDMPTVYISVSMCTPANAEQLTLFISQTSQQPGPGQPPDQQTAVTLDQGYAYVELNATGNLFIGVSAPIANPSIQYSFLVGASVDSFVSEVDPDSPFAFVVDTDSSSALLSTFNLTNSSTLTNDLRQQWLSLDSDPPFSIFVFNSTTSLDGVQNSFCGVSMLQDQLHITSNISIRNLGQNPKQDFFVQNLQPGTTYYAILAYNGTAMSQSPGANTIGGGKVWKPFNFTTKSDGNCQIIYNLQFCSDVAYAVPSNASTNMSQLAEFYDNGAQQYWQNFTNSLQQVACNTTGSAQYSLVKTCNDCTNDYKTWLCSAFIPRCQDLSAPKFPAAYTIARNVAANFLNGSTPDITEYDLPANASEITWFNMSRNPLIDSEIKPGPYKELLPCQDLCYEIVRSCPASMQFSCPRAVQGALFNRSYGIYDVSTVMDTGMWTCNFLGIDPPTTNAASKIRWGGWISVLIVHLVVYGL